MLGDLIYDMQTYNEKYSKIQFKDLSITHPKYKTCAKLYIPSNAHFEYIVFMNPGPIYPFKFSIVMSYNVEVPDSNLKVFKNIINSISMIPNDTINTNYRTAFRMAENNLKIKAGEAYDDSFGVSCAQWLASVLPQCTANLDKTKLKPNTFLCCINEIGEINNIIAEHDDTLSACIKQPFWGNKYPNPPGRSWWVKLDITYAK
jgi:hypothetical protein